MWAVRMQSYTYFTWRNTVCELDAYFRELAQPPTADFFRPMLFPSTPDINPRYLQQHGRPGFLVRAALAATGSGLWGIYSGFELCEAAPLPGDVARVCAVPAWRERLDAVRRARG